MTNSKLSPVEHYDVVVAGAGLVGATFAARLAGAQGAGGLRIAIIDKQADAPPHVEEMFDPRVVALTEASRILLDAAGIWTNGVSAKASPYCHMEVRDGEGTGFIEFDCADVHQPNLGHIVENSVIVAAAHQRLGALANVEIIAEGIQSVAADARAQRVINLDGGRRLAAPLLVAADGANSLVREQCGFCLRTWDYGHSAVVATIGSRQPHNHTAFQWFSSAGPLAFLPLVSADGDCHYSSIVWSQDHQVAADLMALDDDAFCRAIGQASEWRLGDIISVSRRHCLPLRQRHATEYVRPGVALLGDAAHTIHPLAGQGVNLGFADARVLVEEILRGLARKLAVGDISTLERFQRRRKPDNLAMMAAMEGFKRLFGHQNPLLRVLRNSGMSGLNHLEPLKNQLIRQAMGF
ncbi:MAG: UbiH/UbiF/VisC/COQ6 family ubiquinone biosynthesis hydroxylase [Porticoccaceae bacterium]|nr:UbiH/UbiF/VisC/COQ6 family ubiquinone biosynthesis hydroxylase [Porticoccaceae bacterium]